ncbi:hypothetical protein [Thalassotalea sp. ND16A]|uniref:hypothetical protein n=1 Tax=Thalassotalea sp. ND16A TaxID=1535422 RepID=UPI00051A5847|nr:hypothetical protein [Thalassotalea sp. ND16A]KGJ89268.1 hypothetical protein ND16A_2161 [Thalassotalea sp. ND16A]
MKKLTTSLLMLTSLLSLTSAHAVPNVGVGFDQGFGVSAEFDNINLFAGNDGFSADYLLKQGSLGRNLPFNWYVGAGAFIGSDDGYGVRAPLGLKSSFAKNWNVYAHLSPELDFDQDNHGNTNNNVHFGMSGALGVRYAF